MNCNIKRVGIVDVKFGDNVTVVDPVNIYGCEIGSGTFIGPFVEIQKNVKNRQQLQNSIAQFYLRAGHHR